MKYALLIDSENTEPRMDELFQELSKYGDTPIRLLLGDFHSKKINPWIKVCKKHAITGVQTMNFTKGKNSLDISLVIEGMKILYEKEFIDGIIIVASDSDYTPLAREWRNSGKDVIGIGKQNTPESFRASCTKFVYVNNIYDAQELEVDESNNDADLVDSNNDIELLDLSKIKKVMYSLLNDSDGRTQLSRVVEVIRKTYPDFDVRSYGYSKSVDFFKSEFDEIILTEDIKNTYFISYKNNTVSKTKKIKTVEKNKTEKLKTDNSKRQSKSNKKASKKSEGRGSSKLKKPVKIEQKAIIIDNLEDDLDF